VRADEAHHQVRRAAQTHRLRVTGIPFPPTFSIQLLFLLSAQVVLCMFRSGILAAGAGRRHPNEILAIPA
ncbi:MAG TPA: hypothetical protein VKA19_10530, partial [Alphaproteobacteria bacterium]|nr:hypothetical protein [Alphaproteobacteria bacterium]